MTTPVLNRRVTVHGTSTVTRLQPNFYPFEDYGVPPGGNRWGSGYGLEAPYVFLELPAMVSGFADINWITSAFTIYDFPVGLRTDFLPANTPETGRIYLILPIDGELTIVASWERTSLGRVRVEGGSYEAWRWQVEDYQLLHDVPVVESEVRLGYDEYAVQVADRSDEEKTVWCRQLERGVTTGLLRIGDSLGTGTEETAEFTTRYAVDLAVPTSITDDLGRVWTVESARSILDRRYLEYQAFRRLTVLDAQ